MNTFLKAIRTKTGIAVIAAIVVIGGGYYFFVRQSAPSYQFITVKSGSITQSVSVTGDTTPVHSVSLGFGNSGTIAQVYSAVGDQVEVGQMLAQLNTSDLAAQLQQAQANVDAQTANLEGLQAGSQPEDIAASQAALAQAQQNLTNMYASIADISTDAQAKANDAVRTQLSGLFSNPETQSPQLTFSTSNSQAIVDSQSKRVEASVTLNSWQAQLGSMSSSPSDLDTEVGEEISYLSQIRDLLDSVSSALNGAINLSATTLAADKADVGAAQTEVNTATKNLNTVAQNIASQKLTVAQAQAQLALKQEGSTPQAIAAAQAQVEQAQASVASIEAKLQNSKIVAPIGGTVTQFDAKVGEIASPSAPLVSIIGSGFEVDAGVSETDIGKLALGDKVSMTLDAFPGETFAGTVFYIAPSQTTTQGVVSYLVKVSFNTADPRLKSGLTANLTIATQQKDNVLTLPQYAILQNDQGTFVEVLKSGVVTDVPVTLGIQDESGNVEIVSGVSAGEQVLNIGLKQS